MTYAVLECIEVLCVQSFTYITADKCEPVHIRDGLRNLHPPFVTVLGHRQSVGLATLVAAVDKPHGVISGQAVVEIECTFRNSECKQTDG